MALFSHGVLTKKGQALIAKSETKGMGIHITKAVTGSGIHTDTSVSTLENLTSLIEEKQEFPIKSLEVIEGNAGVAVITVLIHNKGLSELYYLNELGIYAHDPEEGDILYCILISTDNMIYLPPENGTGGLSAITERIYLEVVNADRTYIDTTGALAGASEVEELKNKLNAIAEGLLNGQFGQRLVKKSEATYDYSWEDSNTFTGKREDFPAIGTLGSIYIDTDSSEIYVWKELSTDVYGYFKLPLGSEASETLQRQITANKNDIEDLKRRTEALQKKFVETQIQAKAAEWRSSTVDEVLVYKQTVQCTGMTESTEFDVLPCPLSENMSDLDAEQKSIGIFFSHGIVDGKKDSVLLTCVKKLPSSDFGMIIRGKE